MLYYLFNYLDQTFDFPGAGVFRYISFRASAATILSLLIAAIFGKKIISLLRNLQIGESIRDLGLSGQMEKKGTPTMGGFIIIASLLIPVILFSRLDNVYVILLIITTLWTSMIGFADDYIKVFKKDKEGLKGKFKVIGQIGHVCCYQFLGSLHDPERLSFVVAEIERISSQRTIGRKNMWRVDQLSFFQCRG